jgi:hypothetical protein
MPTWVTPTTFTTGQQVTKQSFVDWNASMACVGDHTGWSTWNPDLYAQTSGSGIEVGSDGTKRGRKLKVGKIAICTFDCAFGTTANGAQWIQPGSSNLPGLTPLPWAASTGTGRVAAGWAYAYSAANDDTVLLTPSIYSGAFAFYRGTVAGTSNQVACVRLAWPLPGLTTGGNPQSIAGCRFSGVLIYRTNT